MSISIRPQQLNQLQSRAHKSALGARARIVAVLEYFTTVLCRGKYYELESNDH
jgi:hypothetical protein